MTGPTEEAVQFTIDLTVRGDLADRLTTAARKRDVPPAGLLADIFERVLADDLIAAVLDD